MVIDRYGFSDFLEDLGDIRRQHGREIIAGVLTVLLVWGLILGGTHVAPLGPVAMVVGFGMIVVGSSIAIALPLLW